MRPRKRESAVAKRIRERVEEIEVAKHVNEVPHPLSSENLSFEERMKRRVTQRSPGKRQKRELSTMPQDTPHALCSTHANASDLSSEEIVDTTAHITTHAMAHGMAHGTKNSTTSSAVRGAASSTPRGASSEKMKCGCSTHKPQRNK
ncbi:hypothetical protein NEFER03_0488 [Nematocida sp. LUAm3]|nr:hypothetical protein NEFER03_0488 [Nematocida sp. LUAm3]